MELLIIIYLIGAYYLSVVSGQEKIDDKKLRIVKGIKYISLFSDFFGKDTGCTFDFVKVSPDRLKLYVAVRFESKTVARKIMEK